MNISAAKKAFDLLKYSDTIYCMKPIKNVQFDS